MSLSVEESSNKLVISSATRSGVSSSGSYAKSMVRRLLQRHTCASGWEGLAVVNQAAGFALKVPAYCKHCCNRIATSDKHSVAPRSLSAKLGAAKLAQESAQQQAGRTSALLVP